MKELLVVVGVVTALILTVNTVNGQPLNNGTNNTAIESQPRTFTDCYSSFYGGMIFLKLSEERDVGSEPELKQFFTIRAISSTMRLEYGWTYGKLTN